MALAAALIGVFALRSGTDEADIADTTIAQTPSTALPSETTTAETTTAETTAETTDETTAATTTADETSTTVAPETSTTVEPETSVPSSVPNAPFSLPQGVAPSSLSFPTMTNGWVVGSTMTDAMQHQLLHTTDGGVTWQVATPPAIDTAQAFQVAFADPDNGWIVGRRAGADHGVLYTTHDGGTTWNVVGLDFDSAGEEPMYVAAANGLVHVVTFETPADSVPEDRGPAFRLFTAPAGSDQFAESPVLIEPGAGPVFDVGFAFGTNPDGTAAGWFVYNDRGYSSGAKLEGGVWVEWTAPCAGFGGSARVASSPDGATLVVACSPLDVSDAPDGDELFVSSDGGSTFVGTASVHDSAGAASSSTSTLMFIAVPAAGVIVADRLTADGSSSIVRSVDAGSTWSAVDHPSNGPLDTITTIPESPLALLATSWNSPEEAILSVDGGETWEPVPLAAVSPATSTDRVQIDLVTQRIAGFDTVGGGNVPTPEQVLTTITPILGEPDLDTGWYTVPLDTTKEVDCFAGGRYRLLIWGDLSFLFGHDDIVPGGELLSWQAGGSLAEDLAIGTLVELPQVHPVDVASADGFGVIGSAKAAYEAAHPGFFSPAVHDGAGVVTTADDGTITKIGVYHAC